MFNITYGGATSTQLVNTAVSAPIVQLNNTNNIPIAVTDSTTGLNQIITSNIINTPVLLPDSSYSIPLSTTKFVTSIVVGNITYSPSTDKNLKTPNTFYYDNFNGLLLFNTTNNISSLNSIVVNTVDTLLFSDNINVPDFVTKYNLFGTINISRSFQQHPSISFTILCYKDEVQFVRQLFNSYDTKYIFYGMPFRCSTRNSTIKPVSKNPHGEYQITFSFSGWYQELLDKQVFIKQGGGNTPTTAPFSDAACKLDAPKTSTQGTTSATNPSNATISLSQIASKAGFNYYGYNFSYEYPKSSPPDSTVTFTAAYSDRAITKGLYLCYSNEMGVTTIDWKGVPYYTNSDVNIITDTLSESKNIKPVEYNTVELTLDTQNDSGDLDQEDTKGNQAPKFEYKPPQTRTEITGDPNASTPPNNDKYIKTLDLCFDKSGTKKNEIHTTYQGSTVISQTINIYGYKYLAQDIYSAGTRTLLGGAGNYWQLVETTTTTYLIDKTTGYITGNDVTGWKYGRFKQETDALETVTITESDLKQPYLWVKIPIIGATRYYLRQFRDYYKDAQKVYPYIFYEECNPLTGKMERRAKFDPSWIEPMFVSEEMTELNAFRTMPNPENKEVVAGEPFLPILTVGEQKAIRTKTKIYRSKNTTTDTDVGDVLIGDVLNVLAEDKYTQYTSTFTAQDSGFNNSFEETSDSDSSGKPSQANFMPLPYTRKEDGDDTLDEQKKDPTKPSTPTYQYILTTPPHNPYNPIQNSVSFNTKNLADALLAAKTQLEINDMQQNIQISIETFFNPYIVEGSRYYITYANETYPMRVITNSSVVSIQGIDETGTTKLSGKTTLTLGIDSQLGNTVKLTKIPKPGDPSTGNPKDDPRYLEFQYIWKKGFQLGTMIDSRTRSRANF